MVPSPVLLVRGSGIGIISSAQQTDTFEYRLRKTREPCVHQSSHCGSCECFVWCIPKVDNVGIVLDLESIILKVWFWVFATGFIIYFI